MQICILSHEVSRCFARLSDLEHRIRDLNPLFADFTKIIIWSDRAFVSDSNNWIGIASIANDIGMNDSCLISFLLFQMFDQKLLVLGCAAHCYLVFKNLLEIFHEFIVDSSGSIAFFARKPFFVDFLAITLEAFW